MHKYLNLLPRMYEYTATNARMLQHECMNLFDSLFVYSWL